MTPLRLALRLRAVLRRVRFVAALAHLRAMVRALEFVLAVELRRQGASPRARAAMAFVLREFRAWLEFQGLRAAVLRRLREERSAEPGRGRGP